MAPAVLPLRNKGSELKSTAVACSHSSLLGGIVDVMVAAVVGSAVISVVGPDSSLGRDETLFARKTTVSNS